jgi:hypothetical protein
MQTMRESWTDERLDDLNAKVDRGFDRMERRFEGMDGRFEAMHRLMFTGVVAIFACMFTGFAGLIATQL